MLSIFVETSCNRYERDECVTCHVFEPLAPYDTSDLHLTPEQATVMADKIQRVAVLAQLARDEINLTGGEASMNPHIVEVFKIFQTASPNVCLHTNLDVNSFESKRWNRLMEIVGLKGRIDITLYPSVWETRQKDLLSELIQVQNRLLVNIVYEDLLSLREHIELLRRFFAIQGGRFSHVVEMLDGYIQRLSSILQENFHCQEETFLKSIGKTQAFAHSEDFILGVNLLPAFAIGENGARAMSSMPFPNDPYLLQCPAVRGEIDIMTVRQNGIMTPCCDVGNLKCSPTFGNLLTDSPEALQERFEQARLKLASGTEKNRRNLQNGKGGQWVEEGVPPYCV